MVHGMSVRENLNTVREKLSRVCDPEQIKIVAVTKFQLPETVREAYQAGIKDFGVNYVQEGEKLKSALGDLPVTWHFIGHLQSRKVKSLLDYTLIQSFDRLELLEDLDLRAKTAGVKKEVLIEVNIGQEPQKSGVKKEDLKVFLEKARQLSHLSVKGLMAMPPPLEPVEKRLPYFEQMAELFFANDFDSKNHFLSMGTSEDYELAVKAKANLIRLGTCLLGKRPTS